MIGLSMQLLLQFPGRSTSAPSDTVASLGAGSTQTDSAGSFAAVVDDLRLAQTTSPVEHASTIQTGGKSESERFRISDADTVVAAIVTDDDAPKPAGQWSETMPSLDASDPTVSNSEPDVFPDVPAHPIVSVVGDGGILGRNFGYDARNLFQTAQQTANLTLPGIDKTKGSVSVSLAPDIGNHPANTTSTTANPMFRAAQFSTVPIPAKAPDQSTAPQSSTIDVLRPTPSAGALSPPQSGTQNKSGLAIPPVPLIPPTTTRQKDSLQHLYSASAFALAASSHLQQVHGADPMLEGQFGRSRKASVHLDATFERPLQNQTLLQASPTQAVGTNLVATAQVLPELDTQEIASAPPTDPRRMEGHLPRFDSYPISPAASPPAPLTSPNIQAAPVQYRAAKELQGISGDSGFSLGADEAQPITLPPAPLAPVVAERSDRATVSSMIQQLGLAVSKATDGATTLRLAPVELGSVQIQITVDDLGLRMAISAEIPATLDLIRRHLDQFAQDLSRQTQVAVTIDLGGGNRGAGTSDPGAIKPATIPEPAEITDAPEAVAARQVRPQSDGMDIRL